MVKKSDSKQKVSQRFGLQANLFCADINKIISHYIVKSVKGTFFKTKK